MIGTIEHAPVRARLLIERPAGPVPFLLPFEQCEVRNARVIAHWSAIPTILSVKDGAASLAMEPCNAC